MSTTDMTADEAFNSLNYFDIQAMKAHFGVEMSSIESMALEAMYALVFVLEKRTKDSVNVKDIKMMSLKDVQDYFAEPSADPESEQGKEPEPAA